MVFTDQMIEDTSKRREEEKRINKLMICRATYSSGVPNGIEFAECQDESLKPCALCPVKEKWEKVRAGYEEQEGITHSEAVWLTHQFFGIPTACLCNGKLREAEKKYFPARYAEALKRQNELLNGRSERKEKVREREEPKVEKQMTIFDFM